MPASYGIFTPWKIDPGVNIPYGILNPGSIFRHCILNPIMVNSTPSFLPKEGGSLSNPLSTVYWTPYSYPWYTEPPTHGNLTPPHPWYIEPLHISWLEMRGFKIPWWFNLVQLTIRGLNQYTMDEYWPLGSLGSKYHMTPVILIVEGNRGTRRKPLTCRKSLTYFFTYCCIKYTSPWAGLKSTTLLVIGIDCIDSCKCNYHTIKTMTTPHCSKCI